jgi:hypothetical protein
MSTTITALPRRPLPTIRWLCRSRDQWKDKALKANALVGKLTRRVASLSAGRDRWRLQARALRRQLLAHPAPAKKAPRP